MLKCNLCHRSIYFLAEDLATYIGPRHPVHIPPLPCSTCKTVEYVSARVTELKLDAIELGADAVVGINLDYQDIGGTGKIFMVVATGTAVKLN